ncbi:hypothetical protein GcC1_033018 [Golovinomyces cichoracearum]|uniref:Basic proline-rich protein n=1 Tax=Golovinomyces cichoracearum TaxID=62708 RepID=A0A420J1Y3_9PEZI|nr:hypothetical protein GcC1_033018 [Golovinomyces cichoracearum]
MYSILLSLCGAALFCSTLTQAADNLRILDASEPYAASLPVFEEFTPVPSSSAASADVPDSAVYRSEDSEDSLSSPPFESSQRISPQKTDGGSQSAPYSGSTVAAKSENSDPTYVSTNSVLVSTTTIYQAVSSVAQPSATNTVYPNTTASPDTNNSEDRGQFGTDDGPSGSTPANISSTQISESSSTSSIVYTMTQNATTSEQLSSSTTLSSASQAETTTAISNSSYVSLTTLLSSASATAPISEIITGPFNSSTPQTSTSSTALSSEATSEIPSSTLTSSPEFNYSTNTTSSPFSEVTSITELPNTPGNLSSTDVTSEFPISTLSSSLEDHSPTNTSSVVYPKPTSIGSLSSSMYMPSVTSSSFSGSLNNSVPSTTSSDPLSPSNEPSSLPGNSSFTSFPESSTNTIYSPTSSAIYSSSTFIPIPGNTTTSQLPGSSPITVPYESATQNPNATYTAVPSNSTMAGSSSQVETMTVTTSPTKVMPTATNTGSTFIPSSIIAQTSSSYTTGQTTTSSTGIPSSLPKIVQNPLSSSSPVQPEDTAEVQIGFQWDLNYPFVVGHPLSTSQIFTYLPIGIADGLGLNPEQIVVKNLFPLDTTEELDYITTVARIFIPASMVDTLRIDLGISASPIYQNENDSVRTLMNFINPAIPYFPGTVMQHGAISSVTASHSTSTPTSNSGVFNTEPQQPQSASAKGTTAGIALAACGGAAAYGAAMFLLARRYKHRQQQQPDRPRSFESTNSSIEAAESNADYINDGALMSGGRISNSHDRDSRGSGRTGYSARTAQISGPMMSENSLGWN